MIKEIRYLKTLKHETCYLQLRNGAKKNREIDFNLLIGDTVYRESHTHPSTVLNRDTNNCMINSKSFERAMTTSWASIQTYLQWDSACSWTYIHSVSSPVRKWKRLFVSTFINTCNIIAGMLKPILENLGWKFTGDRFTYSFVFIYGKLCESFVNAEEAGFGLKSTGPRFTSTP